MGADRGVNAARAPKLAVCHDACHLFVQRLTHAVQALKFILTGVIIVASHLVD